MSRNNPTPPRFPLKTSVEIADAIDKLGGYSNTKDLATFLKRKPSGALRESVSSAVKYGLIGYATSSGSGLETTDLYRRIKNSNSEQEKISVLREAFFLPPIFREIMADEAIQFNSEMLTAKIRSLGVDSSKVSILTNTFLSSAIYVGLIEESGESKVQGQLFDKLRVAPIPSKQSITTQAHIEVEDKKTIEDTVDNGKDDIMTTQTAPLEKALLESVEPWKIQIRLPNRRVADLILPAELTSKDYEIIRAQLEVLRLYIENS